MSNRVSTGIPGLDLTIDMLRMGDNVVWQVDSIEDYCKVLNPYITQSKRNNERLVYFRFARHKTLIQNDDSIKVYELDIEEGFEIFASKIHDIIEQEGEKTFYLFDCLSDLLDSWHSDMMVGNFFRIACPFLYQLDTVAYFAIMRAKHTRDTIARIRETTQVLLDVYCLNDELYIHPLKVWERYSPTMFFPHLIKEDSAESVTSSADTAALFSGIKRNIMKVDFWKDNLEKAALLLNEDIKKQETIKQLLISLIIGKEKRITELADRYFSLEDILDIAHREIGTGFIGGKSVGMLLARKILQSNIENYMDISEAHDSYYIGSDIFYTYIVQNGWWKLRIKQKTSEGYFSLAGELKEKMLQGKFPQYISEQFMQMLEHFGQSPIIVRSSSLREDNFGNAFAGKYESVFCANQGSPEQRLLNFEQAVRTVYASTMNEDALAYRRHRGLEELDEQMAILVQRVSGNHYGDLYFPHIAGVGNSSNLYVWDKSMDPNAGMLRIVFGLGTRAVDRISGDYACLVSLDTPSKKPPLSYGDEKKFSQHKADVLDLKNNSLTEIDLEELTKIDIKTDKDIFFSRLRGPGFDADNVPQIADFKKLLSSTNFPVLVKDILKTLAKAYEYPVDIEFTVNFTPKGDFRFSLLQCRPLQTKGLGKALLMPNPNKEDIFLSSEGNFMGGNVRMAINYVIFIKAKEYLELPERDKYQTARLVGQINQKLKEQGMLLVGPGRWGTTTPSLGVPVHFSELCNMGAVCELSYPKEGITADLSFGSHFFLDIVEAGIFYAAIFNGEEQVLFNADYILSRENICSEILETDKWDSVIHIVKTRNLFLHSDIASQKVLVYREST